MDLNNPIWIIVLSATAIFIIIQICARRYDIKWFFQRWYFGEDHLNHRKHIWFTDTTEQYAKREQYVRDFMRSYQLSEKEVLACLKLLRDSEEITQTHIELFKRLHMLYAMKRNEEKITDMYRIAAATSHDAWIKIHSYVRS